MVRKILAALCIMSFIVVSTALSGEEPIGYLFKDKIKNREPVKVYIKDVENRSGQSSITAEGFKTALEQSLHARRSIKFQVVNSPSDSDIQVSAVIKDYQYKTRGPMKFSPGIATMLAETAATASQNYADMTVEYIVTYTKDNKILWSRAINEYVKRKMTPEESVPMIYDVVTRAFVWKCFGKANLR